MKILITGSSGFVGKNLLRQLSKKHDVVPYDLVDKEDIFDTKHLDNKIRGADTVIHLAAFVSGEESWAKPLEYLTNNGIGTFKVIYSAIKNKVKRIIIFSSAAIYGDPLTPYGASKIFAESLAETYKNNIETIVVRPFNIYGRGQNPAYGYAIHNFYNGIKKDRRVEIYGDGKQTRDFIFIDDVTDAVEFLLTSEVPSKPIDLGTGRETSISDLALMVGEVVKTKFDTIHKEPRREIRRSVANTTHLEKLGINVKNFTPLKKGLEKTLI